MTRCSDKTDLGDVTLGTLSEKSSAIEKKSKKNYVALNLMSTITIEIIVKRYIRIIDAIACGVCTPLSTIIDWIRQEMPRQFIGG